MIIGSLVNKENHLKMIEFVYNTGMPVDLILKWDKTDETKKLLDQLSKSKR